MKLFYFILTLSLSLLVQAEESKTVEPFNINDGYYFDWLKPQKAKCRKINKEVENVKCVFHESESFIDDVPNYVCRINKKSELMIYPSKKDCQAQLETMQANAP